MSAEDRRASIVEAAYALMAERGLEGFRVREAAKRAQINHATLLHYFPSRDALVEAVLVHVLWQFRMEGAPHETEPAIQRLRIEFQDLGRRAARDPAFFRVLGEFASRAHRDPVVAEGLHRMFHAWATHLGDLMMTAIAEGALRRDLDVTKAVEAVMVGFRGVAARAADPEVAPDTVEDTADALWRQFRAWAGMSGSGDAL